MTWEGCLLNGCLSWRQRVWDNVGVHRWGNRQVKKGICTLLLPGSEAGKLPLSRARYCLGFVGQEAPVTIPQLCHSSEEAAMDDRETNGRGWAPITLCLQKQVASQIWFKGHSQLTTGLEHSSPKYLPSLCSNVIP